MTRLRLLLLLAGAGTLLAGLPAYAVTPVAPARIEAADEPRAVQLLSAASRAARTRTYSGTQYVASWQEHAASSSVAEVRHSPREGSVVTVRPTAGEQPDPSVTPTTDLDPRLLRLLVAHYDLRLAPDTMCTGRLVHVVEALRPSDGTVAGRFWIDRASQLVLRRETFDPAGRLVRSSAFATMSVGATGADVAPASLETLDPIALSRLRGDGWQIPGALGDLELYDARMRTHEGQPVLHLSYSDGLSTLSVFAQHGRLGSAGMAGFRKQVMDRASVWVKASSPERLVWAGAGRVYTVLSDAAPATLRAAVTALPHDRVRHPGLLTRIGRGLARVGSWLNPFA